jgi:hypothetical protein
MKWIDAMEKLPNVGEEVLTTNGETVVFNQLVIYAEDKELKIPRTIGWLNWDHSIVTHWMPVPQLPHEKSRAK